MEGQKEGGGEGVRECVFKGKGRKEQTDLVRRRRGRTRGKAERRGRRERGGLVGLGGGRRRRHFALEDGGWCCYYHNRSMTAKRAKLVRTGGGKEGEGRRATQRERERLNSRGYQQDNGGRHAPPGF